jgi:hypothetical protein
MAAGKGPSIPLLDKSLRQSHKVDCTRNVSRSVLYLYLPFYNEQIDPIYAYAIVAAGANKYYL